MSKKKKTNSKDGAKLLGFFDPNADADDTVAAILAAIEAEEKPPVPPKRVKPDR